MASSLITQMTLQEQYRPATTRLQGFSLELVPPGLPHFAASVQAVILDTSWKYFLDPVWARYCGSATDCVK